MLRILFGHVIQIQQLFKFVKVIDEEDAFALTCLTWFDNHDRISVEFLLFLDVCPEL